MKKREHTSRVVERTNQLIGEMRSEQFAYTARTGGWMPHVNVYRYPRHYEVVAELAGVEPSDVTITMPDHQRLRITGTRRWPELRCAETGDPCHQTTLLEIEDGAFTREIMLAEVVRSEQIDVEYQRGLVWIRVPLMETDGG
ncbi:MAG: Hsp20/alpha crystallin family protein [Gammaproteobacteria bacterium]|nr:Hsp20/alpha crystallin family protein [Gammaproteobacteria bacterium]